MMTTFETEGHRTRRVLAELLAWPARLMAGVAVGAVLGVAFRNWIGPVEHAASPLLRQTVAFILLGVACGFLVWFPLGFVAGRMAHRAPRVRAADRPGPRDPRGGGSAGGRRPRPVAPVRPMSVPPVAVPNPAGTGATVVQLDADRRRWAAPGRAVAAAVLALAVLGVLGTTGDGTEGTDVARGSSPAAVVAAEGPTAAVVGVGVAR